MKWSVVTTYAAPGACIRSTFFSLALAASACSGNTSGNDPGGSDGGNGDKGGDNGGGNAGGGTNSVPRGTDPGSVAIRRMNATEYNNTVADLFGTALKPANNFTFQDRFGYGFDNNANALEIDNIQVENYTAAAETLAAEVLANPTIKAKILTCAPVSGDACIKTILGNFMRRAFRRPVTDAEIASFAGLVKVATAAGDTADIGIRLAIEAVLSSPNFLYRIEYDPDPASKDAHPVSSYEMASRLSYFFWSTMPDEELFAAAEKDELQTTKSIKAQAERMLNHPKADMFIDTFGALWTPLRTFVDHEVDTKIFTKFTDPIRKAMVDETRSMLRDLFKGDIGFQQFILADYTYANDQLAEHYGLANKPGSTTLKRVPIEGTNRTGMLTHGSFLAATSQPALTSVVKRGRYIFEKMLCGQVGDPPPDVDATLPATAGKTVRENFEIHEESPRCAGCHRLLDPPGFVLEQYDAVGQFRLMDRNLPIDPVVEFETDDGPITWNNAGDLSKYVSTSTGYAECVTAAVYAFALGRGPFPSEGGGDMDLGVLADLRNDLNDTEWKFPAMVNAIISSDPFRMRRGFSKGEDQ